MDPTKIIELANLLRQNGDKILNSEFTLTLSDTLLRALNDSFSLIADTADLGATETFQVVKPNNLKSPVFRELQLIYDFVQKTTLLCIVHYPSDEYFEAKIDISKFHALKRLEVQKTNIKQIVGIQPLRAQLQQLICVKSLQNVDDIITHCGGDHSNGFVWNELKTADFSFNNLQRVDSSLEFAQYLQHLNLRHNQLRSVEAIKWLPNLKTLDLSFNRMQFIPLFHMEACKRLQTLNMSNNFVEDLMGLAKLDAITTLDLSDNCLMDHSCLLPLSALMTLQFINLYGNPLQYHPKHRLATAQFLHKNSATVKFILDFEPLSKSEKAITGTQQMRHVGSLNRFITKSSNISISSSHATPSAHTPASSVGSLRSFKFKESTSDVETSSVALPNTAVIAENGAKKRSSKKRTVEIEDSIVVAAPNSDTTDKTNGDLMYSSIIEQSAAKESSAALIQTMIAESNAEHLEAKKQIENLREKYGTEWLEKAGNDPMMHGTANEGTNSNRDMERSISRQIFNDFLGEFSTTTSTTTASMEATITLLTSTPTSDAHINNNRDHNNISAIKLKQPNEINSTTLYVSLDNSEASTTLANNNDSHNNTLYKTVNNTTQPQQSADDGQKYAGNDKAAVLTTSFHNQAYVSDDNNANIDDDDDEPEHLKNVYSNTEDDEPEISDTEPDEDTYIVHTTTKQNEQLFLTISSNFLREKDTITQRTKTKWSLKILESCDRLKSNTLRINFDTVKADKKERIYTVEDGLCQELETKLRDLLSKRDLSEMNIEIYRCVNCMCQFFVENNKNRHRKQEIRCPDCKSTFVAEIHDIPKSLEKTPAHIINNDKLSPAAIVEELSSIVTTPLIVKRNESLNDADDNISIGSANSLNESSSCSKISHSQSSFDSNQSVVGSSNTDRDNEFRSNCESDVDILSNPSQSSIEVLDQNPHQSSRKTSEERRISQTPNLETIDDHSYTQKFLEHEFASAAAAINVEQQQMENSAANTTMQSTEGAAAAQNELKLEEKQQVKPAAAGALAHFNLTESSSSGSVTDSVCTAYEQQLQADKNLAAQLSSPESNDKVSAQNLLAAESDKDGSFIKKHAKESNGTLKKEETGISSMFGALFQSTNILMSSSKKLLDAEANANIQIGSTLTPTKSNTYSCTPYKFNYTEFNDIDHRLKLYFYQTKFKEVDEHFRWIVRGRIYNENARTLCEGIVVMSSCKCYLMEAFAAEHDDVNKWLRQIVSVTVDRLASIQLLPWKVGLSFVLRDWGGFLLLLQDILRTDSLLLYFANTSLPSQCMLKYQPADEIIKRLNAIVVDEKLQMCALLNGCEIACDAAKRSFNLCALLTTDTKLYLTSGNFDWLSMQAQEPELELCMTQLMSNLVEVERVNDNVCAINFLDDTQDKCELWKCAFETKENAESCLNAIGQSWEQLFGVPLINA